MYKVVIDAGHGGKDFGAINGDRKEKDDVLRMSLLIARNLRDCGITVFLTRDDDTFISLKERANFANDLNADLFVSIHRNSAPSSVDGVEVWVNSNKPPKSVQLGKNILDALLNTFPTNRGLNFGFPGKPDQNFAVNRLTEMASALVEVGFITNDGDNELFDAEIRTIADDISDAILKTLGAECNPTDTQYLTIKDGVWNVRNAPFGSEIIGKVYGGERFPFTVVDKNWYQIPQGWVSGTGVIVDGSLLDDSGGTFILSQPANAYIIEDKTREKTPKMIRMSKGVWNVRNEPNGKRIVTVVYGGQLYPYVETKNGWYKIPMGWVSGKGVINGNLPKQKNMISIKPGHWNIRKQPSLNSEIVRIINGGQIIEYTGQKENWYKTNYGYINKKATH